MPFFFWIWFGPTIVVTSIYACWDFIPGCEEYAIGGVVQSGPDQSGTADVGSVPDNDPRSSLWNAWRRE